MIKIITIIIIRDIQNIFIKFQGEQYILILYTFAESILLIYSFLIS